MAIEYTTIPLKVAPASATSTQITPSATAWAYSAFSQILATTSNAITLAGVTIDSNGTNVDFEVDIAVGAASSEVVVATMRGTARTSDVGSPNSFYFPIPRLISSSGQRISCRLRKSGTTTVAWGVGLMYYDGDISSTATTTTAVCQALPSGAASVSVTASGTSWGNSSWVQVRAATGLSLVLGGVVLYAGTAQPYELDVGVGGAGAETVIATFRGNMDTAAGSNNLVYANPPIDLIPANTRIAVRLRKNNTTTTAWRVALLIYEKPV